MHVASQGGLADFKSAVSQDEQGAKQHSGSSEECQALYCAPSYWPFTCSSKTGLVKKNWSLQLLDGDVAL